jgi:hypothetical protein
MTRMKELVFVAILIGVLGPIASAQTINAASCNASDVQAALNSVNSDGTTVNIPAGNCTWTSTVTYNQTFSTVVQGQSVVAFNGTPGTSGYSASASDNTHITTTIADLTGNPTLVINTAAGKSFRLTGISITANAAGGGDAAYAGELQVSGHSTSVRIDHNHFVGNTENNGEHVIQPGNINGVIDHNFFDATPATNLFFIIPMTPDYNNTGEQYGNGSWAAAENFGTSQFIFAEANVFQNGTFAYDCFVGGRFVFRYNTLGNFTRMQYHGLTPDFHRGCRAYEVYGNSAQFVPNPSTSSSCGPGGNMLCYFFALFDLEGGTGMIWNNSSLGYGSLINGYVPRTNSNTYPETAPPNGWGYCGTQQTGVTSAWDGNTSSNGYPCMDGIGRGKGDLVTGLLFPNIIDSLLGTPQWPRQALVPVYVWGNAYSPVNNAPGSLWAAADDVTSENRDYYLSLPNQKEPATFNGTAGVGCGPSTGVGCASAVAQPSNCTTGVAYWNVSQQTLYTCTSTNNWTASYTPYTYPHPLTTGGSNPPGGPAAPTNLTASVQSGE